MVFGFANMPKTLTNELFMSNDLNYIANAYNYIFKQIHGIELNGQFKEKKQDDYKTTPSRMGDDALKSQKEQGNNQKNDDVTNRLTSCNLNQKQLELIRDAYKINDNSIDENFFASIKNIKGVGEKRLETIKNALSDNSIPETKSKQEAPTSLPEKTRPSCCEFYKNTTIFNFIEPLLPNDTKIKKQFKIDLEWFQGNYQEDFEDKNKKKTKGVYFGKPTENSLVIEKFQQYLKNKKTNKEDWLKKIYSSVDCEQIINKLKELYLPNEQ